MNSKIKPITLPIHQNNDQIFLKKNIKHKLTKLFLKISHIAIN